MHRHGMRPLRTALTPELTKLIVCRKSRFLLENRPRVPPYRFMQLGFMRMVACGGCGAAASHVEICRPWYRLLGSAPHAATRVANGWRRTGRPVTRRLREEFRRRDPASSQNHPNLSSSEIALTRESSCSRYVTPHAQVTLPTPRTSHVGRP